MWIDNLRGVQVAPVGGFDQSAPHKLFMYDGMYIFIVIAVLAHRDKFYRVTLLQSDDLGYIGGVRFP